MRTSEWEKSCLIGRETWSQGDITHAWIDPLISSDPIITARLQDSKLLPDTLLPNLCDQSYLDPALYNQVLKATWNPLKPAHLHIWHQTLSEIIVRLPQQQMQDWRALSWLLSLMTQNTMSDFVQARYAASIRSIILMHLSDIGDREFASKSLDLRHSC